MFATVPVQVLTCIQLCPCLTLSPSSHSHLADRDNHNSSGSTMALPYLTRTTDAGQHLASATSEADDAPTVTVTAVSNPYDDHSSDTSVSKIVPGILIAFFCFTTVCLAYGLMRARRRRRQRMSLANASGNSSTNFEPPKPRKKKRYTKPKLYDVEVKDSQWDADLEALRVRPCFVLPQIIWLK